MAQYRIVPVKGEPPYVWMETKLWYLPFFQKSELVIDINGVTKKVDWENKNGVSSEKIKQTLLREFDIQYKQPNRALDYLRIPSDKLAECECNNGDS